jgi:transposase
LVLRCPEKRDAKELAQIDRLTTSHPDVTLGSTLVQEFATMVRERQPEQLDAWLARTERSGLSPVVSVANGIRKEYAAVRAGLTLKWSNGPTEGRINWLKQVKRQMYGRANFDHRDHQKCARAAQVSHFTLICLYCPLRFSALYPSIRNCMSI